MMAQKVLFGCDSSSNEQTENEQKKELDREEERMKMRYGEKRRRDKGIPQSCDCGAVVHVATSNDPNTIGKLYFSCGFKRWWIPALLEELAKIKEENNELKKELDEAMEQIEKNVFSIFTMEIRRKALKRTTEWENLGSRDEQFDVGIVKHLMDKIDGLEKKNESLEKKLDEILISKSC